MPKATTRVRPPFELIAGNICFDFINTLDDRPSNEPKELLADYGDLVRFSRQSGVFSSEQARHLCERMDQSPEEAARALRRARILREALHEIFVALERRQMAPKSAIEKLNAELHDAASHSNLTQRRRRWEVQFDDLTTSFRSMLWPIARAAAEVLTSDSASRVRTCLAPTCQWFFLDTSKNHQRRWCSMKLCGNRAKVRKFYARNKKAVS